MATRTEQELRRALAAPVDHEAEQRLAALIHRLGAEREPRNWVRSWGAPVIAAAVMAVVIVAGALTVSALRHAGPASPAGTITAPTQLPVRPPTPSASVASPGPTSSQPGPAPTDLVAKGVPADPSRYHSGKFSPNGRTATLPGVVDFETPSGNIACTYTGTPTSLVPVVPVPLICGIEQTDFTLPARPASCGWNWASSTVEFAVSPRLGMCLGAPVVTWGSNVLPYGSVLRFGGFACYSGQSALVCLRTATGHGFTLSRQAYTTF